MRLIPSLRRREVSSSRLTVPIDVTTPSGAGWVTGDVSLPVAAAWGECVFPAGDYTLVVPSWAPVAIVHVQGVDRDAVVFAAIVEDRPGGRTSALTLLCDGTSDHVRSLELKNPGIVFHFYSLGVAPDLPRRSGSTQALHTNT